VRADLYRFKTWLAAAREIRSEDGWTALFKAGRLFLVGRIYKPNSLDHTKPAVNEDLISDQVSTQTNPRNIVIDHSNWNWYNDQPQNLFDKVGKLKIFFAHASVGANVLQGLFDLNQVDPLKYPLIPTKGEANPPALALAGKVYEYPRGNPSWSEKISAFQSDINNGWRDPKVDIVMNKFCYIDQAADCSTYCNSMAALEFKYPGTKFVYWTMPLTASVNLKEVLRSQFNNDLRTWVAGQNDKMLFDIADIESWNPTGQHQTFTLKGARHEKLFSGYTTDGGHLNPDGRVRVATGLYSLFGKVVERIFAR
jgi:hypothetical protein